MQAREKELRRYDMNGRFQVQGCKNWIFPKEMNLLGLLLAWNLVKPLISLYGTEWRKRGYGLCFHPSPFTISRSGR
jgi:hypothetical protein